MVLKLSLAVDLAETPAPVGDLATAARDYRDAHLDAKEAAAAKLIAREPLEAAALIQRTAQIESGDATTTIEVPVDGNKVQIIYQERYKSISIEHVPALREAFGDRYALYCDEVETVKMAKGVTADSLRAALGDEAFALIADKFATTTTRAVKPRKGTIAQLAELHARGETGA